MGKPIYRRSYRVKGGVVVIEREERFSRAEGARLAGEGATYIVPPKLKNRLTGYGFD